MASSSGMWRKLYNHTDKSVNTSLSPIASTVHSIAGQWMHESFWWLKKVPIIESLISNVSWVLTNIMSESSPCFWKENTNSGCRLCIIVCSSFWEDYYMLISKCWNRITKSKFESAKCDWRDRDWNHRQCFDWKVQKIPILSMGPTIRSPTFVCTLSNERQILNISC